MKPLLYFTLIILLGCSSHEVKKDNAPVKKQNVEIQKHEKSFTEFISGIKRLTFPIKLVDSADLSYGWGNEFDTNDVIKFHLIKGLIDTNDPYSHIKDYICAPIGYFTNEDNICLIYKTRTTQAGSGNPEIILRIFDNESNFINRKVILTYHLQDNYHPYTGNPANCTILNDSIHFSTIELFPTWYQDFGNNYPLHKLIECRTDYVIVKQLDIKKLGIHNKTLFEDKNHSKITHRQIKKV